ncbi:adp-glucose pyrophosphorylase signature 2 [Lucifera butyrica]|uniref:Glucose-1-phosphate adenylyltransferase n=1 Tax=Lucifera butyrica TaxID=1351585 RepID=A0A498R4C6_9FIRM|nr:glucose-1-phosphate adenylyltransferase [Lucifera butyrica]VBB05023.1 adp-glucose pyrophosphorylase signature 2 [Lucifera butyrica]
MLKKECIAMILAGGQGSRLGVLTKNIAKPAVPFGGKYRIIDFTLSNCYNSGLDTVGVLTQYQPLYLHTYIGIGSSWDLDRKNGGVFVLPPFVKEKGGQWYTGTANAIYQNMNFIDQFRPEYVLVLSGDHIYKMDYSIMLDYHKEKQADTTIAVIEVPWKDTSHFGIMNTGEGNRIETFEEKPKQAKSNLASMGIYIFNWDRLRQFLIEDEQDPESSKDFGKNIIPKMLQAGLSLYAYPFKGYWKDVGLIESLWQANMDLLKDEPELDLADQTWRIYSVNPTQPPHYIGKEAKVVSSLIGEGCQVFGEVDHSVLFPNVYIDATASVKDSVIMAGVRVGPGAVVEKAIIGRKTVLEEGCRVGCRSNAKVAVVGDNRLLARNTVIEREAGSL